jgi:anaerobic selenocysteine-containing dehydrogenase
VKGTRKVLFMNAFDISRLGLEEGSVVTAQTVADDGVVREVGGLSVRKYSIPQRAVGGYYPELNPLIPLWHHAKESQVPAAKSIPIRLRLEATVATVNAHA